MNTADPFPQTMTAVLLTGHGGSDVLEYREDIATPSPGPNEVLIKIAAAGVNNTDINTRIGWYSKKVTDATSGGGSGGSLVHAAGAIAAGLADVVVVWRAMNERSEYRFGQSVNLGAVAPGGGATGMEWAMPFGAATPACCPSAGAPTR